MLRGIWLLFVVHRIPQPFIMPPNLWWNNHFKPVFDVSSIISRLLVVMDIVNPVVRETQIEDTNTMTKRKKTKGQTIIYKILRIKLKIEQHEPIKVGGKLKCHWKKGNTCSACGSIPYNDIIVHQVAQYVKIYTTHYSLLFWIVAHDNVTNVHLCLWCLFFFLFLSSFLHNACFCNMNSDWLYPQKSGLHD